MKIAMWSGPRNLSTAMMYAFGNRADTQVVDEPFYGAYLHHSNADHPMREDIIASMACDPAQVSAVLAGPVPDGAAIWYQKHMTHHMLEHFSMDLLANLSNVFLIRDPARVIASYARKRAHVTLYDLGFVQQKQIFEHCLALGQEPIVIDSDDVLANPKPALMELCARLEIAFDPAMLHRRLGRGHKMEFGRPIGMMRCTALPDLDPRRDPCQNLMLIMRRYGTKRRRSISSCKPPNNRPRS
jgi:hypothetical protein